MIRVLDIMRNGWHQNFHLPFKVACFSKFPKLYCFSCRFITFSSFSFPSFSLHLLWNLAEWLKKGFPKASPPLNLSTFIGGHSVIQTSVCGHLVPHKLWQDQLIELLKSFVAFSWVFLTCEALIPVHFMFFVASLMSRSVSKIRCLSNYLCIVLTYNSYTSSFRHFILHNYCLKIL